jgi:hypothetical protein
MFKFSGRDADNLYPLKLDGSDQYYVYVLPDGFVELVPVPVSISKFPTAGIKLVHGGGLTTSWQVNLVRPISFKHTTQE